MTPDPLTQGPDSPELTTEPIADQDGQPWVANTYNYVGNDPLNFTDPQGLFRVPGTNICVDIADPHCHSNADGNSLRDVCVDINNPNCESGREQHPEGAQQVANAAGGVFKGTLFGQGDLVLRPIGLHDSVDWNATETTYGVAAGYVFSLAYGAGAAAEGETAVSGLITWGSRGGGAVTATRECWDGFDEQCAYTSVLALAGIGASFTGLPPWARAAAVLWFRIAGLYQCGRLTDSDFQFP